MKSTRFYAVIIALLTIALIVLGSAIVMSASSTYSVFKQGNQFALFKSHISKGVFAIGLLMLFAFIPVSFVKKYTKHALILSILILFVTAFFMPEVKGARRWFYMPGFSFQPADLVKTFLFLHLAVMIDGLGEKLKEFKEGLAYPLIWVGVVVLLFAKQPNMSNAIMTILVSVSLLYIAGARIKHLVGVFGSGFIMMGGLMLLMPHSRVRILNFFNSVNSGESMNIQVQQALYSLGSGGLFGVGFGHSNQRNLFLPEAHGDFVFAILGEELGFVGAISVLIVFMMIGFFGILIAKNATNRADQLIALVISLSIVLHAVINASVASGFLPTTGIPLPLVSHGGTNMIFVAISIGILVQIGIVAESDEHSLAPDRLGLQ